MINRGGGSPLGRPERPQEPSPGLSASARCPGFCAADHRRPERARELIPDITLIKFNFVALQERAEFVLKRHSFVVFALGADVFPHFLHPGLAHRKRAITSLPIKIREPRSLLAQ